MNELLTGMLASVAGATLGTIFFGGLWWTVHRGLRSRRPALWFLGSLLLRMGVTLAGFYFVAGGRWERLTACLLGFILARLALMRLKRPLREKSSRQSVEEASHAP